LRQGSTEKFGIARGTRGLNPLSVCLYLFKPLVCLYLFKPLVCLYLFKPLVCLCLGHWQFKGRIWDGIDRSWGIDRNFVSQLLVSGVPWD
jgi:hypothetical protein